MRPLERVSRVALSALISLTVALVDRRLRRALARRDPNRSETICE
ncbi:MAG TPA: hypothetical protein VE982_07020 [Gaiellaceae bacterium]|nr:hypothetical protein [Gaiellaceae bacterium]